MRITDDRRTCCIICTGQSAGRLDLEPARKFARIVVNDAYILDPSADALYAADTRWWRFHGPAVRKNFAGTKYCPDERTAEEQDLEFIKIERRPGLSETPGVIRTGGAIGNSGAQAINLAYLAGARRIVLIGMDMGGEHFFGKHPAGVGVDSDFRGMIRCMATMAFDLDRLGVEVINTSDCSQIAYWPGGKAIPLN